MQRLRSRQKSIPNGYYYRQSEINWDSRKSLPLQPSFDTLVRALMAARRANPHHAQKHNWALDFDGVANDVETFNVKVCLAAGWTDYLTEIGGGAAPPFNQAQSILNQKQLGAAVQKVKKLWAGVKTLNDWLDSGSPPVESALAEKRAVTCAACPLNGKGDFSALFTVPASAMIKRQLERLVQRNISTTQDDNLNVCTACLCPLRVKVQTPMEFIKSHLPAEVVEELKAGKDCWILSEMSQ